MDVDTDTESEASASSVAGDDRVNLMRRRPPAGDDSASQPEHSSSSVRGEEQQSDKEVSRPAKQASVEHQAQTGAYTISVSAILSPDPSSGSRQPPRSS